MENTKKISPTDAKNLSVVADKSEENGTSAHGPDLIKNAAAKSEKQAKGAIMTGVARLTPIANILMHALDILLYYMKIPFVISRLTIEVIVLSLEISKLALEGVKANSQIFVRFLQQLLAIGSPDFIQSIPTEFTKSLQMITETFLQTLQNIVEETLKSFTTVISSFKTPFMPGWHSAAATGAGEKVIDQVSETGTTHTLPLKPTVPVENKAK